MNFNKSIKGAFLSAVAVVGLVGNLDSPSSFIKPAEAASGSRLCGWRVTMKSGGEFAYLYEARTADASYESQCKGFKDAMWNEAIKVNASLLGMGMTGTAADWVRVMNSNGKTGVDCESVSPYFVSTDQNKPDMCDNMQAKTPYMITKTAKSGGGTWTSYCRGDKFAICNPTITSASIAGPCTISVAGRNFSMLSVNSNLRDSLTYFADSRGAKVPVKNLILAADGKSFTVELGVTLAAQPLSFSLVVGNVAGSWSVPFNQANIGPCTAS